MGFLNSIFNNLKRKPDESTVGYLERVGDAVKDGESDFSLIDEAEVYFSYGRIEQGLDIINDVLRSDPRNEKALEFKEKYSNLTVDEATVKYQAPAVTKSKRKYLVSVIANVDGNTFPQNFEISSEFDVKETKEGNDFLKKTIDEQGYNSWGLLSVVELKG